MSSTFIDDLLNESKLHEDQKTEAYYDLLLIELRDLEREIKRTFEEADREKAIIDEWALQKSHKHQEKANFIKMKLEAWIREEEKKTIDLAHGTLKVRKSPDRVTIENQELFLAEAKADMLDIIPEQVKPNLNKIKAWIAKYARTPMGVKVIEGTENFSVKLKQE